ncbi:MAG: DUF4407 domain-containing protein [Pseudonocardiaceae bacterium]
MQVDFKKRWLVSRSYAVILVIFAGVTAVALAYGLNQAFDVAVLWAILGGIVAGVVTLLANLMYVTRVPGQDKILRRLIDLYPVVALAVIFGVILSAAATMKEFRGDFLVKQEKALKEELIASEKAEIRGLGERVTELQDRVDASVRSNVDEDLAVSPLLESYRRARDEFDKSEKEYLCELDGSCGTKDKGVGYASEPKRQRRDDLKGERDAATRELDNARQGARTRIDRVVAADQAELDETRRELAKLKDELSRIESSPIDDRPVARPGAFVRYILHEITSFVLLVLLYVAFHMVPVVLPKADVRRRVKRNANREAVSDMLEDANRDRVDVDLPRRPAENLRVGLNGSKVDESKGGDCGPADKNRGSKSMGGSYGAYMLRWLYRD